MKTIGNAIAAIGMCAVGVWAMSLGHETAGELMIFFGILCLFGD